MKCDSFLCNGVGNWPLQELLRQAAERTFQAGVIIFWSTSSLLFGYRNCFRRILCQIVRRKLGWMVSQVLSVSVSIYLNVPNIQEEKNQCNCYIKDVFRSAVFRSTDLLLPARSYQIAYERTTPMTKELISLTSANQIFWINFLVHLWNWGGCEYCLSCCGLASPTNNSGTWASDSRRASCCAKLLQLNNPSLQQVLRSLIRYSTHLALPAMSL